MLVLYTELFTLNPPHCSSKVEMGRDLHFPIPKSCKWDGVTWVCGGGLAGSCQSQVDPKPLKKPGREYSLQKASGLDLSRPKHQGECSAPCLCGTDTCCFWHRGRRKEAKLTEILEAGSVQNDACMEVWSSERDSSRQHFNRVIPK